MDFNPIAASRGVKELQNVTVVDKHGEVRVSDKDVLWESEVHSAIWDEEGGQLDGVFAPISEASGCEEEERGSPVFVPFSKSSGCEEEERGLSVCSEEKIVGFCRASEEKTRSNFADRLKRNILSVREIT